MSSINLSFVYISVESEQKINGANSNSSRTWDRAKWQFRIRESYVGVAFNHTDPQNPQKEQNNRRRCVTYNLV